ncbi:hypothetical protein AM432_25050 (plasmid) [Enterobacter cloacae complex sp.]|uniref:Uncharacterized protein n=1 Tax=Enterobacter cloacae subsp. cloacae (strain ATCC 13047 / DSM 30054 / NBRC 13535 / NCTC 10005 / WDCM 00083 / NCDC 279-56) TaxID=716541 RepID=A0A0H3CW09_ENTCC|nr:hypothetical protein ECL_A143 [Enterobacter cloacae subsp. cloacae ATCC 13047]AQT91528.1 hypothetical protein B1H21_23435 [Enterobacter roggenkampii]ASA07062.1 hypothetical protein AM432_25050 [Enterobacter cloacae complex sp.]OOC80872.1 hypothetical protein BWP06_22775 [Enterobacter cloacae]
MCATLDGHTSITRKFITDMHLKLKEKSARQSLAWGVMF